MTRLFFVPCPCFFFFLPCTSLRVPFTIRVTSLRYFLFVVFIRGRAPPTHFFFFFVCSFPSKLFPLPWDRPFSTDRFQVPHVNPFHSVGVFLPVTTPFPLFGFFPLLFSFFSLPSMGYGSPLLPFKRITLFLDRMLFFPSVFFFPPSLPWLFPTRPPFLQSQGATKNYSLRYALLRDVFFFLISFRPS